MSLFCVSPILIQPQEPAPLNVPLQTPGAMAEAVEGAMPQEGWLPEQEGLCGRNEVRPGLPFRPGFWPSPTLSFLPLALSSAKARTSNKPTVGQEGFRGGDDGPGAGFLQRVCY